MSQGEDVDHGLIHVDAVGAFREGGACGGWGGGGRTGGAILEGDGEGGCWLTARGLGQLSW